jgi:hypothetical protein
MLKQYINEKIEDGYLREKFQQETKILGLDMIKVTCYIGIIFYPIFGALDIFVYPDKY